MRGTSTRQSTSVHGPASRAERACARNADDAWQTYDPATFETAATTDGGGAAMALEAVGFMALGPYGCVYMFCVATCLVMSLTAARNAMSSH